MIHTQNHYNLAQAVNFVKFLKISIENLNFARQTLLYFVKKFLPTILCEALVLLVSRADNENLE